MNFDLRAVLKGNAAFSVLSGAVLAIVPGPIALWLGGIPSIWVRLVGLGVIGFGVWVALLATRERLRPATGYQIAVLDALWVIASAVALVAFWSAIPVPGKWLIGVVAIIVADFAIFEYRSSRTLATA